MPSKKELKARIKELEALQARAAQHHKKREAEYYKQLQSCVGEGFLVLPQGGIVPVIISDCQITRDPYSLLDAVITVYPQPPQA